MTPLPNSSSIERIPPDWPHRDLSHSIRIGELDWHVQVGGSGPVMLLLHGTGASAHSWADVISAVRGTATIIAPDLPGHGFTRGARMESLTLPRIAADLDALLAALGFDSVRLVAGHSAGAPLAIRWALGQQTPPVALVGFNSALISLPRFYTQFVAPVLVPLATSPLVASVVARLGTPTGMVDRLLRSTRSDISDVQRRRYEVLFRQPSHVRGAMGWMAAADLPALVRDAPRLASRTTFVLGSGDDWVPEVAQRQVISRAFPDARVQTWAGGHLLHEADPARAARLLLDCAA